MWRRPKIHTKVFLLIAGCLLSGCDPQKAALKIFTDQGLTLLEPARDYIALGGIVVLPKQGRPQYIDPFDSITGADGTYSQFNAVIQQQLRNRSIRIETAVGTLGDIVPIPAGLNLTTGQTVELAQIDTAGSRLTFQMVSALLKKSATDGAIRPLLQGGNNRVFVIQEVYTGKSLSLKSSSSTGLKASVEGGAQVPNCGTTANASSVSRPETTATSGSGTSSTSPGTTPSSGASTTSAGTTAPNNRASTGSASSSTHAPSTSTPASNANNSTASGNNSSSTGANVGIALGVCLSNQFTLTFQTSAPIPFAVRLIEVQPDPGGVLAAKITHFVLPNTALGNDDAVRATALVEPLEDMEHKWH
jgi:hypothetical protein